MYLSTKGSGYACYMGSLKERAKSTGMVWRAYLCCCSTSSSRFLPSRLLLVQPCRPELGAGVWKVLMPPRGARREDWHTWRANPLILFSPRNPLVLAFFLSCCLKAFSPVETRAGVSRLCSGLWSIAFNLSEFPSPEEEKNGQLSSHG